jgi:hypothetical protein
VELKSPYVGFKSACATPSVQPNRASSRFGKIRSRPQTSFDEGIEELDEKFQNLDNLHAHSESPTDLQKIKIDITHFDVIGNNSKFENFLTRD